MRVVVALGYGGCTRLVVVATLGWCWGLHLGYTRLLVVVAL